ncbi:MAG: hypothetical protein IPO92_07855 [Saprospiraceae bacterium]|nr:hypothetical protein [Saprospiraceae bacterium]
MFSLILFSTISNLYSQATNKEENIWKSLSKISYKKEYDELMGFKIDKPVFSESVKAMQGKEIIIKGYIIPVEGYKSHKEFIFSAFPYSSCFFCGGAGPETVMEVEALEGVKYVADAIVLKGIIQLNDKDVNRLMYKLVNAKVIKQ